MEIRAMKHANWVHGGIQIFVLDPERKIYAVLECKKDENEYAEIPAAAVLRTQQAQTLMDDLWNAGLRPSEGSGSAGAMAAVQQHLADMRKIAFVKLGITNEK